MSSTNVNIKIGVETQLAELRAMEAQFARQIVQLRTLGGAGTENLKKVEQNLGLVRTELNRLDPAARKAGAGLGSSFGGIGRIAGQAGYQVQDLVVQVGAGQNALVAFAQQGSQLAGIFGPYGAMAGAALALGAVAANFLFMRDSAKDTKAETKALADETKRAADQMERIGQMTRQNTNKLAGIDGPDTSLYNATPTSQLLAEMADRRKQTSDLDALASLRKMQAEGRFAGGTIDEKERNRLLKEGNDLRERARYLEQGFAGIVAELNRRKEVAAKATVQDLEDERFIQNEVYELETKRAALGTQLAAQQDKDIDAQERAIVLARERAAIIKAERALSLKLAASAERVNQIAANPYALNKTKDAALAAELARQNADLAERIGQLEKEQATTPDPVRSGQITAELDARRAQQAANTSKIDTLTNPPTVQQGAMAGVVQYLNSIPSAAQRAQQSMVGLAQSMQQGVGSSLRGLITDTMSWGAALENITNAIMDSILQSFVDMIAQWIVSHTIMAAVKKAFGMEDLATTTTTEAAKTAAVTAGEGTRVGAVAASTAASTGIVTTGAAAQTAATGPAAVFRSIMDLGPIAGPLVFATIIGGMLALVSGATKGFAEGGPVSGPGTGTSDSIAAWLSNGEYVMPADKTAKYRPLLDAMRDGSLEPPASAAGGAGGMGGGGAPIVINNYFQTGVTRAEFAAQMPEYERRIKASIREEQRRGKV